MRWLAPAWMLLGCAPDEVVVAVVLAAPDAGGTPSACSTQADCPAATFCSKSTCEASAGECLPRPTLCVREPSPVCGCDGVTYLNDCLRMQSGVPARQPGECTGEQAQRCGGADQRGCPAGSYCARLVTDDAVCGPSLEGRCWVIPRCDEGLWAAEIFAPCSPDATAGDCVDACTAITSEQPHRRVLRCRGGAPVGGPIVTDATR